MTTPLYILIATIFSIILFTFNSVCSPWIRPLQIYVADESKYGYLAPTTWEADASSVEEERWFVRSDVDSNRITFCRSIIITKHYFAVFWLCSAVFLRVTCNHHCGAREPLLAHSFTHSYTWRNTERCLQFELTSSLLDSRCALRRLLYRLYMCETKRKFSCKSISQKGRWMPTKIPFNPPANLYIYVCIYSIHFS